MDKDFFSGDSFTMCNFSRAYRMLGEIEGVVLKFAPHSTLEDINLLVSQQEAKKLYENLGRFFNPENH